MKQINLKLPDNLFITAQSHVNNFGFRNIQDLATESIREKVFEKNEYNENFSKEEIEMIGRVISLDLVLDIT